MSENSKKWLVRSGSFIYGPFTEESIIEQLLDKRLTVRDEVIGAMKNWLEIYDELHFTDVVEELRKRSLEEDPDESTKTTTISLQDLTNKPTGFARSEEINNELQPIKKNKNLRSTDQMLNPNGIQGANKSKNLTSMLLIFLVPILGLIGFNYFKHSQNNSANISQEVKDASERFNLGDFTQVIENLSKIDKKSLNGEAILILTKSFVAEKKYNNLKQFFDIDYEIPLDVSSKNNLLGLAAQANGENSSALKYFNQSISADDKYLPPYFNLLVTAANTPAIIKHVDRIKPLEDSFVTQNNYVYLYMLGNIFAYEQTQKISYLNANKNLYSKIMFENSLFQKEINFLYQYSKHKADNSGLISLQEQISIVDHDFDTMENYLLDPSVNGELFSWKTLTPLCESLTGTIDESTILILKSYCAYKKGDSTQAIALLSKIDEVQKSPLTKSLNALYLGAENNTEMMNLLKMSEEENDGLAKKFNLPLILNAKQCLKDKDPEVCLDKKLYKLQELNPKSVIGNYLEAQKLNFKKEFQRSLQSIKKLNALNKAYKPSLKLCKELKKYVDL